MRFELAPKHLENVLLELQGMTDEPLEISLINEEPSLLAVVLARLRLVEEKRRPWVHAFGHDLEAGQIRDHDQIALETLRELFGEISERSLDDLLEACGGGRPRRWGKLTIEVTGLQEGE